MQSFHVVLPWQTTLILILECCFTKWHVLFSLQSRVLVPFHNIALSRDDQLLCGYICPSWLLRCWRVMRNWLCRWCLSYPEEQVETNLTSLMAWSRRAGQRRTATHSEVRSSKLSSSGTEPAPTEESRMPQWLCTLPISSWGFAFPHCESWNRN